MSPWSPTNIASTDIPPSPGLNCPHLVSMSDRREYRIWELDLAPWRQQSDSLRRLRLEAALAVEVASLVVVLTIDLELDLNCEMVMAFGLATDEKATELDLLIRLDLSGSIVIGEDFGALYAASADFLCASLIQN